MAEKKSTNHGNLPATLPVWKVSTLTKIGYGIGDIGNNIFIVAPGLYLLYFLTDVLKVNPALAGLVLFFPKLWDVIFDPIMGAISDKTNSRWGRRRPYLLFGALPFGLSFALLFWAPAYSSELAKALYVGFMYAIGCTFFSLVNVPYSSMVAEMSEDYNERMSITSFRMIGSSIGVLLAGGLALPLVKAGGDGLPGYLSMGAIFGVMIAVLCLLCFWGTRNAVALRVKENPPPMLQQIKIALQNKPFFVLMSSYVLQSVGMGVLMAGLIYYIIHVLKQPKEANSLIFTILIVTAMVFIPIWLKIGVKIGKIKAYRIGLCIIIVMLASTFFTQPSQLSVFYGQIFFLGIGFSSFQLFPFSMLPDTIEYDEMKSGLRREGIFSGVWASAQKMAYAVGPSIVGFALSLSNFDEKNAIQPASVETGIRIVFCLVPPLMLATSFIPFSKYDLTEQKFIEIKKMLPKN